MDPSPEVLLDLHRRMVRIRHFEEAAGKLAEQNRLPGFLHLYVGEEAVAAGCAPTSTTTTRSARPTGDTGTSWPKAATTAG